MKRLYLSLLLLVIAVGFSIFHITSPSTAVEYEAKTVIQVEPVTPVSAAYILPEEPPIPEASQPEVGQELCCYRDDIISDGNLLSYELQVIMQDCSAEYGVPYSLLLAIADTESRFDPNAASSTNDYGLMQINKCNHEWLQGLGIDPMTPEGNIRAGAYMISQHLQNYGETELALMAYNCGPTGARKLWNSGVYQTDYSRKVMAAMEHWKTILEEQPINDEEELS